MALSSAELRRDLSGRNLLLAENIPHESTCGAAPSVLYQEANGQHGNFLPASYRRICASSEWSRRLEKHYTASRTFHARAVALEGSLTAQPVRTRCS
jgi:hypothetical protein